MCTGREVSVLLIFSVKCQYSLSLTPFGIFQKKTGGWQFDPVFLLWVAAAAAPFRVAAGHS